jgi:hypothetical protein
LPFFGCLFISVLRAAWPPQTVLPAPRVLRCRCVPDPASILFCHPCPAGRPRQTASAPSAPFSSLNPNVAIDVGRLPSFPDATASLAAPFAYRRRDWIDLVSRTFFSGRRMKVKPQRQLSRAARRETPTGEGGGPLCNFPSHRSAPTAMDESLDWP